MKQTTNMARVIGEIQKIARCINHDWFDDELELEKCVFTVQSTPKSYGHFTPYLSYRVHSVDGEKEAVEINIGAGTLDRDILDVVCTLIHEMVHWYNWSHQIQDCSRNNTYHSKKFKNEAERRGLVIGYDSRIGWSLTSASEELVDWVIENDFQDFRLGRNEWTSYFIGGGAKTGNTGTGTSGTTKPKTNSIKMICPCCGNIARVTKKTYLICGDCMEKMIES